MNNTEMYSVIEKRILSQRRAKRRIAMLCCVCTLIAGVTGVLLIMPADTQSRETFCGFEEHIHSDECYKQVGEKQLICTIEEGTVTHEHADACYEEQQNLICTLKETAGHTHTDACYEQHDVLSCGQEETSGHAHTDACYSHQQMLSCTLPESAGHVHDGSCYDAEGNLICTVPEGEGAHTHDASCYTEETSLICGMAEGEGAHTHSDACYTQESSLICGQEEEEAHQHTDTCYEVEKVLTCTESTEPHVHTDACYLQEKLLTCEKPVHEHTLKCFANPTANLENPEIWERPFQTMELTGNWREDVISVAQTQLGYTESSANYIVDEFDDTRIHGYTRYGAWYGYPYSEWCAMFCSFVYHYAEVDSNVFPCSYHLCTDWVDALTRAQLWHSGEDYIPQPGDLIFFDTEKHDGLADHVGLVYNWNPDTGLLTTIEGNRIVAVDKFDYYLTDDTILGFGELPENPELAVKAQEELSAPTEAPAEEAEPLCTCAAEEGQPHAEDCPLYVPECTCGAAEEEEHAEDCPVAIWQAKKAAEAAALAEEAEPTCTCGAEEGRPHAKDCPLYVPAPVELRSAPASDGAVAVVNGVLPEGAEVTIEAVTFTEDQLIAYFGAKRAAAMKNYVAYDIKIMVNGEEWQPDESVSVVVEHPAIEVAQGESFGVAHIDGVTDEVSTVKAEVSVEGDVSFTADAVVEAAPALAAVEAALPEATLAPVAEVSFEAEGFSVYFFYTFTVDFHFGDITFCMEGRSEMLLSELFAELGILSNAADVYSVTFSDPSLIEVQQVEGDWLLISLEPFDTDESLYIEFNDGTVLIIAVTDAQKFHWQKVDSIGNDPLDQYMIVYENGNTKKVLGLNHSNNSTNISSGNSDLSPETIEGQTLYQSTLGKQFKWYFIPSGDGYILKSANQTWTYEKDDVDEDSALETRKYKVTTDYYLTIGSSLGNRTSAPTSTIKIQKDNSSNKYIISSGAKYYLRYNNGNFTSTTDSSKAGKFTIYKLVNVPPTNTSGGSTDPVDGPSVPEPDWNAPDFHKRIDALRDNHLQGQAAQDNPHTTLDEQKDIDQTDLYRLYLDIGPESRYKALDILFVADRSTSMSYDYIKDTGGSGGDDGQDATDIQGAFPVWRRWALNSMMNGLEPAKRGTNNSSHLVNGDGAGILSTIKDLHFENQVSVVGFALHGFVLQDWKSGDNIQALTDDYSISGTNYVDALAVAKAQLSKPAVKNNGRHKIIVFISDGEPTQATNIRSMNGTYARKYNDGETFPNYASSNNADVKEASGLAITDFRNFCNTNFPNNYSIYTIGVGSFDTTFLSQLSGTSGLIASTDFQKILYDLDSVITDGVGRYSGLEINEVLSEYVDFYSDADGYHDLPDVADIDLMVQRVPVDANMNPIYNQAKVWYQNGQKVNDGTKYIDSVTLDPVAKTVHVVFNPEYKEEGGFIYSLSFNVKTTQKAYNDYAANLAADLDGYAGTTGQKDTDFITNNTSSNKPGFLSNKYDAEATALEDLQYTYMSYAQSIQGETRYGKDRYQKPVIQVSTTELEVVKDWTDDHTQDQKKHSGEKVQVTLNIGITDQDGNEVKTPVEEGILQFIKDGDKNNWKYKFTDLPKKVDSANFNFYVEETKVLDDKGEQVDSYRSEVVLPDETNGITFWTVRNSPKSVSLTLIKTDERGVTQGEGEQEDTVHRIGHPGVTFELYTKDAQGQLVPVNHTIEGQQPTNRYMTDSKGEITFDALDFGTEYWLREITAPPGYNKMEGDHMFKLVSEGENVVIELDQTDTQYLTSADGDLIVKNYSGYELPKTGGHGTAIYYISGSLLAGFALIYGCFAKQKKREGRHAKT